MRTYTIEWQRPTEEEHQTCHGLSPRILVARLRSAVKNNGSITVWRVEPDGPRAVTVDDPEESTTNPKAGVFITRPAARLYDANAAIQALVRFSHVDDHAFLMLDDAVTAAAGAIRSAELDLDEAKGWRDRANGGWQRAVEERDAARLALRASETEADILRTTVEKLVDSLDDLLNIVAPYLSVQKMAQANRAVADALARARLER